MRTKRPWCCCPTARCIPGSTCRLVLKDQRSLKCLRNVASVSPVVCTCTAEARKSYTAERGWDQVSSGGDIIPGVFKSRLERSVHGQNKCDRVRFHLAGWQLTINKRLATPCALFIVIALTLWCAPYALARLLWKQPLDPASPNISRRLFEGSSPTWSSPTRARPPASLSRERSSSCRRAPLAPTQERSKQRRRHRHRYQTRSLLRRSEMPTRMVAPWAAVPRRWRSLIRAAPPPAEVLWDRPSPIVEHTRRARSAPQPHVRPRCHCRLTELRPLRRWRASCGGSSPASW